MADPDIDDAPEVPVTKGAVAEALRLEQELYLHTMESVDQWDLRGEDDGA